MGKIQSQLSPEKYIKTKARTLPIHECWINKDWEETRLASIFISRMQPSGNLTVGVYLVDLNCLGVKDTAYFFNQSPIEYAELLGNQTESLESEECNYALAHNIIFASLEFAQEYNIMPEKDFAVSRFILEDDEDENVPLIDIECGEDGVPHLILMEDQVQKYTKVLAQLRSYPGEGNFLYTIQTEDGEYDRNADEEDNDLPLPDDFLDRVESGEASVQDESMHAVIDLMYRKKNPVHHVDIEEAGKYADSFNITYEALDEAGSMSDYEKAEAEKIDELMDRDYGQALNDIRDLVNRFPLNSFFANQLFICLHGCSMEEEANKLAEENFKKFPSDIFSRTNYATYLLEKKEYSLAKEIMYGPSSLMDFVLERPVHYSSAIFFFSFWSLYYIKTEDIAKAEFYYRVVWWIGPHNEKVEFLRIMLTKAKTQALGLNVN